MDDLMILNTQDRDRVAVLKALYVQVQGNPSFYTDLVPLAQHTLGISREDLKPIYHYLKDEGFIELMGAFAHVKITSNGIKFIENVMKYKMTDKELILSLLSQMTELAQYPADQILERMGASEIKTNAIIDKLLNNGLARSSNWRKYELLPTEKGMELTPEDYEEIFHPKPTEASKQEITYNFNGDNHGNLIQGDIKNSKVEMEAKKIEGEQSLFISLLKKYWWGLLIPLILLVLDKYWDKIFPQH